VCYVVVPASNQKYLNFSQILMYNNATTTCWLLAFVALEASYNIGEVVVSILRNTVVVLLRCCLKGRFPSRKAYRLLEQHA